MERRRFQIGPSTVTVEGSGSRWFVIEHWPEIDRRGEADHESEQIGGPYSTHAEAEDAAEIFRAHAPT